MAIKMVSLTCNHCGANLDIDLNNLMVYCPFCGQKLMIDAGQMIDILKEKEKTKQKGLKYERDVSVVNRVMDTRERKNRDDNKALVIVAVIFAVFLLALWIMVFKTT